MGRALGWIGPLGYVVAVAVGAVLCLALLLAPDPHWHFMLHGQNDGILSALGCVVGAFWVAAVLWFVAQAAILTDNPEEDERWSRHMLQVAFVGRLVLLPLSVIGSIFAVCSALMWASGAPEGALTMAVMVWLGIEVTVLPIVLYQICGATRLANRGLLGATALVIHTVLAFFPCIGFVAMSSLLANGREDLTELHDRRVAQAALDAVSGDDNPVASPEQDDE